MMKHCHRVLAALNHEEPDCYPMQVSFTPEFAARIKREMALKDADLQNPRLGSNTYTMERRLDADWLPTSVGWANSNYASENYDQAGDNYTDERGIMCCNAPYKTRFGTGHYTEMVGHPLADDKATDDYRPPGTGFIFAAGHDIQAYVPPETIIAAFETALEYGRYA